VGRSTRARVAEDFYRPWELNVIFEPGEIGSPERYAPHSVMDPKRGVELLKYVAPIGSWNRRFHPPSDAVRCGAKVRDYFAICDVQHGAIVVHGPRVGDRMRGAYFDLETDGMGELQVERDRKIPARERCAQKVERCPVAGGVHTRIGFGPRVRGSRPVDFAQWGVTW